MTHEEALAFIEAIRKLLAKKAGYKWHARQLESLGEHVRELGEENERLRGRINELEAD